MKHYKIVYCQIDVIPTKKRQVRTVHERMGEFAIDERITPDDLNMIERQAWRKFDDKSAYKWRSTTGKLYVVSARSMPCEPLVIDGKEIEGTNEIEVINFFTNADANYQEQIIFKQRND